MDTTPALDQGDRGVGPDWHARTVESVATELGTAPHGLDTDECRRRIDRDGPNEIPEAPPTPRWRTLLNQFRSPLIYILLAAGAVTFAFDEYTDTVVIVSVLLINAAIGYVQERRAEVAVRSLNLLVTPRARVVRDGREREVPARDLVPGDVVLLESGTRVPADLRLVSTNSLLVDESLMTGESVTVLKDEAPVDNDLPAEQLDMAWSGTTVTAGRGFGYVVATGPDSSLGAIAADVQREVTPPSPLQERMAGLARLIAFVVLGAAVVTFIVGTASGESAEVMFAYAVALAVSAIPEGLPVVLTITLALGVRRMAARHAITRRLPAVEALGSTTVIGTDKTGTLTENRMSVEAIRTYGRSWNPTSPGLAAATADPNSSINELLMGAILSSEAQLYLVDGERRAEGDPTETALLELAADAGLEPEEVRSDAHVVAEIPFESARQYSAVVVREQGEDHVLVKGAPERVIALCDRWHDGAAEPPLGSEALELATDLAGRGMRVLAFAARHRPAHERHQDQDVDGERAMALVGLVGLVDPPRLGVADAISGCRRSGIRPVMITGDHAATALAIGTQLGLAGEGDDVLTGSELQRLSDEDLAERAATVSIYARVTPEQKLRVVQALHARAEVVAVTGDGVNDAPALRAAEIGVAMGRGGTDVAREAADMVLADDNFSSIYAAVEEGRVTFDNVRKVTFYLLSSGVAEVAALFICLALGWPLILLPTQILWLNLMTNPVQDVALAFEKGEPDVLDRPPRPRLEGVLSRLLWVRTALVASVMAAGTLIMFRWELDQTGSLAQARTVALVTMVLFQVFHIGNVRSERRSAFAVSPLANPYLLIAAVGVLAVQVLVLYLPPTQVVLHVEPLSAAAWLRAALMASTVLAVGEAHKLWVRRHGDRVPRL